MNYAIVGCVELSVPGRALGFSDAGMFNLVKALELTLNDGVCMQSGKQIGLKLGTLEDFQTFEELEEAYKKQIYYFTEQMERGLPDHRGHAQKVHGIAHAVLRHR